MWKYEAYDGQPMGRRRSPFIFVVRLMTDKKKTKKKLKKLIGVQCDLKRSSLLSSRAVAAAGPVLCLHFELELQRLMLQALLQM